MLRAGFKIEDAQQYTVEALEGLAQIARNSTSDAARVAAWWVVPQSEISGS